MKLYMLLNFLGILRETQKVLARNVKLMSCIMLLIISTSSVLLVSNLLYVKPAITDLALKATLLPAMSPTSPEFATLLMTLTDDLRLFAALEWIFTYVFFFATVLFATATILASAVAYCGKDSSLKELLLRALKSLKSPLITWFYITLLHLGYSLFFVLVAIPFMLGDAFTRPVFSIAIFVVALAFEAYLAVVWNLALVVSVLEEKCGIEALGKGAQLINGSKLRGFLLNLLFVACSLSVLYFVPKVGRSGMSANAEMIALLLLHAVSLLIRMFTLMAYTVLYHECKATHGEELEMQGRTEYSQVKFSPLVNADVP